MRKFTTTSNYTYPTYHVLLQEERLITKQCWWRLQTTNCYCLYLEWWQWQWRWPCCWFCCRCYYYCYYQNEYVERGCSMMVVVRFLPEIPFMMLVGWETTSYFLVCSLFTSLLSSTWVRGGSKAETRALLITPYTFLAHWYPTPQINWCKVLFYPLY